MALADVLGVTDVVNDPMFKYMYLVVLQDFNMPPSYIQGISCPVPVVSATVQWQAGYNIHYPNKRNLMSDQIFIQLYEDQSLPCLNYFMQWGDLIVDPGYATLRRPSSSAFTRNNFYPPSSYKRTILVYPINSSGMPVCEIKYSGCFPAAINGYDFETHGWQAYVSPTIQIYIDTVEITWLDTISPLAAGVAFGQAGSAAGVLLNAANPYIQAIAPVASNINLSYQGQGM